MGHGILSQALDRLDEAARASAPLDAQMEEVISALPRAAALAARASASASGAAAGADAGAGPSLRDLLGASSELNATDDPGLEDPLEFFMVRPTKRGLNEYAVAYIILRCCSDGHG